MNQNQSEILNDINNVYNLEDNEKVNISLNALYLLFNQEMTNVNTDHILQVFNKEVFDLFHYNDPFIKPFTIDCRFIVDDIFSVKYLKDLCKDFYEYFEKMTFEFMKKFKPFLNEELIHHIRFSIYESATQQYTLIIHFDNSVYEDDELERAIQLYFIYYMNRVIACNYLEIKIPLKKQLSNNENVTLINAEFDKHFNIDEYMNKIATYSYNDIEE